MDEDVLKEVFHQILFKPI